MLVVADTTPINDLVLITQIDILVSLYEEVVAPSAVAAALRHPKAPPVVRAWIAVPPLWCTIRQPQAQPDPALMHLGAGEREALILAEELGAGAFLTDDLEGREEAMHHGIEVTGTLGILEGAAQRTLLDLPAAIAHLQATTFYGAPDIIAAMLARDAARKKADVAAMRRGIAHVVVSGHRSCDRHILSCQLKVGSLEWSAKAHAMTQVLTGVLAPSSSVSEGMRHISLGHNTLEFVCNLAIIVVHLCMHSAIHLYVLCAIHA